MDRGERWLGFIVTLMATVTVLLLVLPIHP
jgi:hypothetical protein